MIFSSLQMDGGMELHVELKYSELYLVWQALQRANAPDHCRNQKQWQIIKSQNNTSRIRNWDANTKT
jgi:hypothetical protein